MSAPLLSVRGLSAEFASPAGPVRALSGVGFDLGAGEIMGLVGESGGGKSVLGFALLGLIDPPGRVTEGQILLEGEDLAAMDEDALRRVRGGRIGMVFQDPMTSLNPVRTIGRQMDETLRLHTPLGAAARREACVAMLARCGISEPARRLDAYPHQLSGGMRQRVVIAIALLAGPRLIVADEPTTALDVTIQAQILRLMRARVEEEGASMILISHDLAVVARMAGAICVLYCGRIVERGPAAEVIAHPAHPYTRGLIGSIPAIARRQARLSQIPGTVPDLRRLPSGCAFRPRCPRARALCAEKVPPLAPQRAGLDAACHFPLAPGEAA